VVWEDGGGDSASYPMKPALQPTGAFSLAHKHRRRIMPSTHESFFARPLARLMRVDGLHSQRPERIHFMNLTSKLACFFGQPDAANTELPLEKSLT
jgi:hypothetical protein